MNESLFFFIFCVFQPAAAGWPLPPQASGCKCFHGEALLGLRDVAVLVCRGLASLDVLLVDEHLDALLDHADTRVEPGFGLIDHLHGQTVGSWILTLVFMLQAHTHTKKTRGGT